MPRMGNLITGVASLLQVILGVCFILVHLTPF